MNIFDSDFDDNEIEECGKCPRCGKALQYSRNKFYIRECTVCDYKEAQYGSNQKSKISTQAPNVTVKLEFFPKDKRLFQKLLIEKKQAKRTFYDENGNILRTNFWNISRLTENSNLIGNIESSQVYRDASEKGIAKIRFDIEGFEEKLDVASKAKNGFVLHKK